MDNSDVPSALSQSVSVFVGNLEAAHWYRSASGQKEGDGSSFVLSHEQFLIGSQEISKRHRSKFGVAQPYCTAATRPVGGATVLPDPSWYAPASQFPELGRAFDALAGKLTV